MDYKKFYTNICILTKKIVCNQDKAEKAGVGKEEEKEFDNPFTSDSDDIGSVSALLVKKVLINNCTYKINRFCVMCVYLSIRFKILFHYFYLSFY